MKNRIGILSFFLSITLFAAAIFSPSKAVDTASLLPNAVQQFFDNNGNPLSSGYVYTYDAGTSTLRTTWKDSAETLPNTNPIRLDAGGKAIIYGQGTYRQLVKDRNQNIIWDAVTAPGGGGATPTLVGDGNLVGTVLPWSGLIAPSQYVFAYGQEVARATYPEFFTAITQQLNVICSSASNTLTGLSDTSSIRIGSPIELALCVAPGTTVTGKTAATITLSNPSSVSINAVATIFNWGNGDGSTTFNVPDFRGITLVGRTNMGGSASSNLTSASCPAISPDSLGASCGSQTTTLITANLPPYTPAGLTKSGGSGGQPAIAPATDDTATLVAGAGGNVYSNSVFRTIVFTGTAQGGLSTPLSRIQPSVTINYIVKITPDTSTSIATGVYSLGGMSGIISCGTGLLCTGNIISFNQSTFAGGVTNNIQYNNSTALAGSSNFTFISPDTMTLGAVGTLGKFKLFGNTSGNVTQQSQAIAGTPTVTWGTSSGTPAVTASSPLAITSATGNVTCSTCVTPSSTNVVTNSNLSQVGAATFKGNPTNALANAQDFTIQGLTARGAPDASNDKIPLYDNAAGTIKYVTPAQVASSATAGVSTLNSLAGGLTITGTGISVSAATTTITLSTVAASQANQQAGTSNVVFATPLHQQDHPSAVKAWARWVGATGVVTAGYNVSSVTRSAAGTYIVNFTTPFSASTSYGCSVSTQYGPAAAGIVASLDTGNPYAAGSIGVLTLNTTFTITDPTSATIVCLGGQ